MTISFSGRVRGVSLSESFRFGMSACLIASALALAGRAADPVKAAKAEPAKPKAGPAVPDVQDLVYFSEQGIHKIRLHILVNGKSATQAWNTFVDKVFAYFDRNGDGHLSPEEVGKMMQPSIFLMGINGLFNGGGGAPKFADMDTNKDGKIDREEFRNFVRRSGFNVIQVNIQPPSGAAEQLSKAFYKHVNARHDGRLTREDLAAAWERLEKLDLDEDELITAQELQQQTYNPFVAPAAQPYMNGYSSQSPNPPRSFLSITPGESAEATAGKVLQVLQASKQSYLNVTSLRLNSRMPDFVRTSLRKLDVAAVSRWLEQPPEMELDFQLGSISEGIGSIFGGANKSGVRVRSSSRHSELERATSMGEDGKLRLTLPGDIVEFVRGGSNDPYDGTISYYRQQFKTEAGDKGYLEKEQIRTSPQFQFLIGTFDYADRNGDGKLTVKEFNEFVDLLQAGTRCQVSVQVTDSGRGIFDLIDTNHDQRLSRRELINAAKNFARFDRNGDGVIERHELPRQLQLSVAQGNGNFVVNQVVVFGGNMDDGEVRAGPGRGPAWFRRMDRNHDGDVSAREFLGTPEEFRKIDTDGDGLISPQEAQDYDKRQKQSAEKQSSDKKKG
jgi:Ca2+-binding EF-hand superfamily protein